MTSLISPYSGMSVVVPTGATHLFLAVGDSHYSDNGGWVTVTIENLDNDGDGVPDDEDWCLDTDLNGPVPTQGLDGGALSDSETINGCNATQILACMPGQMNGALMHGLNEAMQELFGESEWRRHGHEYENETIHAPAQVVGPLRSTVV